MGGVIIRIPILNRKINYIYRKLGANIHPTARVNKSCYVKGKYSNLVMKENSEINVGCFLLTTNEIIIGKNSTLAYNVIVLTSANPNAPYNELSKIYQPISAPVVIGDNCWVGAGSLILPGVEIGDFSVVAAGSVVTRNVPSGVMVAGNPAVIKKYLKFNEL